MKISKEAQWKIRKQTRFNHRLLTEVKQNATDEKRNSVQFRTLNARTTRFRKQASNVKLSKRTLTSYRDFMRKTTNRLRTFSSIMEHSRVKVVKNELETIIHKLEDFQSQQNAEQNFKRLLRQIFEIGELINQNFYSYKIIENQIKVLNQKVKELKSSTCQFYCYTISGLILFQYSSYSLAIFYFDRALKCLSQKNLYRFECQLQLSIYKSASKIFLQRKKLKESKDLAYMYLRKAWKYKNIDQEFIAYDLLGQIELEDGNIQLSRYFHWRMCHAVREEKQILQMSNQQLQKNQNKIQFSIFQDILQFVRNQQQIVGILSNHFRSEAEQQVKGFMNCRKKKQIFMYTHRSSNRVLRNYRTLQRRLIDEKESAELHFIRTKDIKRLRKIITDFSSFIFELKKRVESQVCKDTINFFS